MNSVRDMLRDADPLRHEPPASDARRDRMRRTVVAEASRPPIASSRWFRTPLAVVATIAIVVLGFLAASSRRWPHGSTTVQAAVRFEVRLAEDQPAAGLREARVTSGNRSVYLHEEVVVTNADIDRCAIVPGSSPSRFNIGVRFNAAGADKMRQATANHVNRPIAILIDGEVVMAPVLRDPIGESALVSGDYSQAEAERIVNGIGVR
jgi:preprotein translocase subunit SecD